MNFLNKKMLAFGVSLGLILSCAEIAYSAWVECNPDCNATADCPSNSLEPLECSPLDEYACEEADKFIACEESSNVVLVCGDPKPNVTGTCRNQADTPACGECIFKYCKWEMTGWDGSIELWACVLHRDTHPQGLKDCVMEN